jgi:hypothetical protein
MSSERWGLARDLHVLTYFFPHFVLKKKKRTLLFFFTLYQNNSFLCACFRGNGSDELMERAHGVTGGSMESGGAGLSGGDGGRGRAQLD